MDQGMQQEVAAELEVEIERSDDPFEFQIARGPAPGRPGHRVAGASSWTASRLGPPKSAAPTATASTSSTPGRSSPGRLLRHRRRLCRSTAGHRVRPVDVSAPQPLRRGRQALRFCRNRIRSAQRLGDPGERVSSWVGQRLQYVPGSSDPIDGAVDTMLAGAGVSPGLRPSGGRPAARGEGAGPGWSRCMRPACTRWTSRGRRGLRRRAVAGGRRHAAGPARTAWCASPPDETPPDTAFLDNHNGAIFLNLLNVRAVTDGMTCRRTRRPTWRPCTDPTAAAG